MTKSIEIFMDEVIARSDLFLSSLSVDPYSPATDVGVDTCTLSSALNYSLANGGKRIRPVLVHAAARAVSSAQLAGLDNVAGAVELVHTYSLIHDDLPAMDDDDLRRGKPSLHKAFDEATAILVGDGLQAKAFELLVDTPGLQAAQKLQMVKILALSAGFDGMVGGQAIDMGAVGSNLSLEQVRGMHTLKTSALIRAALALGAIAAGATSNQLATLDEYGSHVGLAFQVVDDILDVEGDTKTLGKTRGKDDRCGKPTYVKLMGLDGAKAEAQRLYKAALDALGNFSDSADHLRNLARFVVERNR